MLTIIPVNIHDLLVDSASTGRSLLKIMCRVKCNVHNTTTTTDDQ